MVLHEEEENSSLARHAEAALLIFCRRVRFSTLTGPDSFSNGTQSQTVSMVRHRHIDCRNINFHYDIIFVNQR